MINGRHVTSHQGALSTSIHSKHLIIFLQCNKFYIRANDEELAMIKVGHKSFNPITMHAQKSIS